ncbi:hypothetical protein VTK26DRAFT_2332 [Humicola hyalothermophila]
MALAFYLATGPRFHLPYFLPHSCLCLAPTGRRSSSVASCPSAFLSVNLLRGWRRGLSGIYTRHSPFSTTALTAFQGPFTSFNFPFLRFAFVSFLFGSGSTINAPYLAVWLMKLSNMDGREEISHSLELGSLCPPHPKPNLANFSYPRTDFIHFCRQEKQSGRGSLGSDSSVPGMVEDIGSDFSLDDDCMEGDLWDSFLHVTEPDRGRPEYPALIDSAVQSASSLQYPLMAQTDRSISPAQRPGTGSQNGRLSPPVNVPCPKRRPQTPKPPPKVVYSLFPIADAFEKRIPAHLPQPSPPQQQAIDVSSAPISQRNCLDSRPNAMPMCIASTPRPGSSRATTPNSKYGGSMGSADSIPLLIRSNPPSSQLSASLSPLESCSSRRTPTYPSPPNLLHASLFKSKTRSSPSLARHAMSNAQTATGRTPRKMPTQADLNRPLPPLPIERPPSPPHISVFETDSSDDEEEAERGSRVVEAKNLARRFMHGLVHHHNHQHSERRDKSPGVDHKRSVSDEGPSACKGRRGNSSLARAVHAARQKSLRTVVSMDLLRDGDSQHFQPLTARDEVEKSGTSRLWTGRQGGDLLLGKILRRKG